jgi:hypothetical protein
MLRTLGVYKTSAAAAMLRTLLLSCIAVSVANAFVLPPLKRSHSAHAVAVPPDTKTGYESTLTPQNKLLKFQLHKIAARAEKLKQMVKIRDDDDDSEEGNDWASGFLDSITGPTEKKGGDDSSADIVASGEDEVVPVQDDSDEDE